jgi:electron transport complex protein RnfB
MRGACVDEGRGKTVGGLAFIGVAIVAVVAVVGAPFLPRLRVRPPTPNPLVSEVLDVLPGGNCGACGNESCFGAAVAVAAGRAPASVCSAGGPATAAEVASVLGSHGRV